MHTLPPGHVQVWRIDLSNSLRQTPSAWLDAAERKRAASFKFDVDRRRFIAAHCAMRSILGRHCGTDPDRLALGVDARGKPTLEANRGLQFNLTHSEEMALLAISYDSELGVDLEIFRPARDSLALAARHFSQIEHAWLLELPPGAARERGFLQCWTRKEAFVKCTGVGLRADLREITAGMTGCTLFEDVWIQTLPDEGDFLAALAVRGAMPAVQLHEYRESRN